MISCHIHDYIEISCLYRLKIKLLLKDGHEVIGIGKTTHYNENKDECMMVETKTGNMDIVLTEIISMIALENNQHFNKVIF